MRAYILCFYAASADVFTHSKIEIYGGGVEENGMKHCRNIIIAVVAAVCGCKERAEVKPQPIPEAEITESNDPTHVVVANGQGEIKAELQVKGMDELAQKMGWPTETEMDATRTFVTANELRAQYGDKTVKCGYVARYNAKGYLDPDGKIWDGILWDGGVFPILETANGLYRSVTKADAPERYQVVYFPIGDISLDPKETDWMRNGDVYTVEQSTVPWLCGAKTNTGGKTGG